MSNPEKCPISSWTTTRILAWIKSLNIKRSEQQTIISSFTSRAIVGANLLDCKDYKDLWKLSNDGFNKILDATAKQFWNSLQDLKNSYSNKTSFRNKLVLDWTQSDLCDWIWNFGSNIRSEDRQKMINAASHTKLTARKLMDYENGNAISIVYGQYGLSDAFCGLLYSELKKSIALSGGYRSKGIESWTNLELQGWIKSITLDPKTEQTVIAGIQNHSLTGNDFADCSNAADIANSLNIETHLCYVLFDKVNPFLKKKPHSKPSSTNNVQKQKKDEYEFHRNQQIHVNISGQWCPAVIEEVKKDGIIISLKSNHRQFQTKTQSINKRNYNKIRVKQTKTAHTTSNANTSPIVPVWEYKNIDEWNCNELQEWIIHLKLNKRNETKMVKTISEQEIGGEDFNTMTEIDDIMDALDINHILATQIFNALNKLRENTNNNIVHKQQNQSQQYSTETKPNNAAIIGLNNLGNTCFINSVIQGLLQTPPLVDILRTWIDSNVNEPKKGGLMNWVGSKVGFGSDNSSSKQHTMLDSFIEITRASMQQNRAVSPDNIVNRLKFEKGKQGTALNAVSKMLELLDKDIIERMKQTKGQKQEKPVFFTGSFSLERDNYDDDKRDDEDLLIEGYLRDYNVYKSPIRQDIHFVERNVFMCLECGWNESRYDIKDKVVLPLKDYYVTICVDIYIPSKALNGPFMRQIPFKVLDYCRIETLQYMVYEAINGRKIGINDINQISIGYIAPNQKKLLSGWKRMCNVKSECAELTQISNGCIFAVVDTPSSKRNKSAITVTTFHVLIDKNGVNTSKSYLEFSEMKEGSKKSFGELMNAAKSCKLYIFFDEMIRNSEYECEIDDKNATIICFWIHNKAQNVVQWAQYNIDKSGIDIEWKVEIYNNFGENEDCDYQKVFKFLDKVKGKKLEKYKKYAEKQINKHERKQFVDECMTSLNEAVDCYRSLAQNQEIAMNLVFNAFNIGSNTSCKSTNIIGDLNKAFNIYQNTKVIDRGATVKCRGKCNKRLAVFKQETKIVAYPQVLIFAIDRYIDGYKFDDMICYGLNESWHNNKYELYAVCNHSGSLAGGHYWAYVKGYDDGQWYDANDERISPMRASNAENQNTAMILMYKKK